MKQLEQLIAQKKYVDAAENLGRLLQQREASDFFVVMDAQRRARRGFKAELRRLIGNLPPEGRSAYELQFGADANALLKTALNKGTELALQEVIRRYYHTKAGYEALYHLGHHYFDRGRFAEAAICFGRLRRVDSEQWAAKNLFLLALSQLNCGNSSAADSALKSLQSDYPEVKFHCREMKVFSLLLRLKSSCHDCSRCCQTVRQEQQTVPLKVQKKHPTEISSCRFPHLRWYRETTVSSTDRKNIASQLNSFRNQKKALLPLYEAIAVGDLVLMRTPDGFAAFDLANGNPLWRIRSDEAIF